jgi:two-component system sensor histidine kinase QseC
MKRLTGSLQARLLAGLLGAVLLVWAAAAVITWRDANHELDELLDGHLAQAAALLVAQQARELEDSDGSLDAPQLHRYAPRVAFQVWHEGQLVLRSPNAPTLAMVPLVRSASSNPAGVASTGPGNLSTALTTVQINGTDWRVFTAMGAETDVQVIVGEQLASRQAIGLAMLHSMLWPMALALPLLAALVWWAVRHGLAPLRTLSQLLSRRDPQDTAPLRMAASTPPAEIAPLVDALNGLLDRINTMVASQRRFTADAAHELRTPIAGIRAQAQVALAEPDAGERRHALLATVAGCDRATHLVDQLLTLSRLEAGDAPAKQPLDLSALARSVAAALAPGALANDQQLSLAAEAPCLVVGNEALLTVLLRNLLDNALRYSPHGATVQVSVAAGPQGTRLTVDDSGPGLSDDDKTRLGQRFFRVLGSGLGWSIVRRIAAAQGASVQVARSAALGGLQVVVDWPAA